MAWGSDKRFCLPRAGCRAYFLTDLVQVRKWNKNGFVNGEQQANMRRGLLRIFFSEMTPTLLKHHILGASTGLLLGTQVT